MNEEENIQEQPEDDRQPTTDDSEKSSKSNSVSSEENETVVEENTQHSTPNIQHNKENMEVHHPHHLTHKKKWTEYLLEFLMLFLAVFLGFMAENIREGYVERHREKQFMSAMARDIELDLMQYAAIKKGTSTKLRFIDTVIIFFSVPFNCLL
jgi:hypothetical protein